MTVADTTFMLNRKKVVAATTDPVLYDYFEDHMATVQIKVGIERATYRIEIDGEEFFYKVRNVSGNVTRANERMPRYIAARLMYGGYSEYRSPNTSAGVETGWDTGGSHPKTTTMMGATDQDKKALGLIQSGRCSHFIHTETQYRDGEYGAYTGGELPDEGERTWRLYGDKTKWLAGSEITLAIEYFDATAKVWTTVSAAGVSFDEVNSTSDIATAIASALNAVSGPTLTGLTCTATDTQWWGYEIDVDYSGGSDTEIRAIYVIGVGLRPDGVQMTARRKGSAISIMKWTQAASFEEGMAGRAFELEVDDDAGGANIAIANRTAVTFEDLPNVGLDGQIVKVQGALDEGADDYYVKFVANLDMTERSTSWGQHMGPGVWEESAKNIEQESLDAATMPQVLLSKIDDTDGSVTGTPNGPYFQWEPFTWTKRTVGDSESNKSPSFLGNTISAMTYHRGRLGMMSGESLSMSETTAPGNFYRTSVTVLRDTDRIDITASSPRVSLLRSAVEIQENLILFSDQTQFLLNSGGSTLTPATAGLELVSSYDGTADVLPVPAGFSAYFPFFRGEYSGIYRLYPAGGSGELFQAEEITAHVPKYIKGKVAFMAVSQMENALAVVTEDLDTVYCYKWADSGNKRIQSAWYKFTFDAAIRGIGFADSNMYVALNRQDGDALDVYLERIRLEHGIVDSGSWYVARLDRRIDQATSGFSMSETDDITTMTLPYKVDGSSTVEIIYKHGVVDQIGGFRQQATVGGSAGTWTNSVTFTGDHTGKTFYFGIPYTMRHTLSAPYFESGKSGALITGRVQIRRAFVDVSNTGSFSGEVTPTGRTISTDYHPSKDVGIAATAEVTATERPFTVPIFAQSSEYVFDLVNDGPFPSRFVSLEYEATYSSRSKRIG